jgi:catechol O-methyltransferase
MILRNMLSRRTVLAIAGIGAACAVLSLCTARTSGVIGATLTATVACALVLKSRLRAHLASKPSVALAAVLAATDAAGSPDAVLAVLDTAVGLNMSVGPEKGVLIDSLVEAQAPRVVVELGAYYGYSAVRIGRLLRAGAMLYSIEVDAECARISARMVEIAGLAKHVRIVVGSAATVLPRLRDEYGVKCIDVLLIDHAHEAYLPDVRIAEGLGLLRPGSTVIADNMSMAKEYRAAVCADPQYESKLHPFTLRMFRVVNIADGVLVSRRLAPDTPGTRS